MRNELTELQAWYAAQCDGEWEHAYGVEIGTLDNPGWTLRVDLNSTILQGKPFARVERSASGNDWLRCWVERDRFEAAGGASNLADMLRTFLDWSKSAGSSAT